MHPRLLVALALVSLAAPSLASAANRVELQQKIAKLRINQSDPYTKLRLSNQPWKTVYDFVRPDVLAFENYIVKLPNGTEVVTRVEGLQDPKVIARHNSDSKNAYHDLLEGGHGWEVKSPRATGQRWIILGKKGDAGSIVHLDAKERRMMSRKIRGGFRSMFDEGRWVYSGYTLEWERHDGTKVYDMR